MESGPEQVPMHVLITPQGRYVSIDDLTRFLCELGKNNPDFVAAFEHVAKTFAEPRP